MGHTARQRRSDFLFATLRLLSKKGQTRTGTKRKPRWEQPHQQSAVLSKAHKDLEKIRACWHEALRDKLALEQILKAETARKVKHGEEGRVTVTSRPCTSAP